YVISPLVARRPPTTTLFPYATLFRSAIDAGIDHRDVEPLAVELPGDAGHVVRLEDVEAQGMRPEVAQPHAVVLAAMGAEDVPAGLDVLANELEADSPRGPYDQCIRHGSIPSALAWRPVKALRSRSRPLHPRRCTARRCRACRRSCAGRPAG